MDSRMATHCSGCAPKGSDHHAIVPHSPRMVRPWPRGTMMAQCTSGMFGTARQKSLPDLALAMADGSAPSPSARTGGSLPVRGAIGRFGFGTYGQASACTLSDCPALRSAPWTCLPTGRHWSAVTETGCCGSGDCGMAHSAVRSRRTCRALYPWHAVRLRRWWQALAWTARAHCGASRLRSPSGQAPRRGTWSMVTSTRLRSRGMAPALPMEDG